MAICLNYKSDYSFYKSCVSLDEAIFFAKANNYSSLCLIDENLYASYKFINKCKNENIKPIIGLDVILSNFHYYLIAKNNKGLENLRHLTNNILNKEEISFETLQKYNEGIILILSSFDSKISALISENKINLANDELDKLKYIYQELYFGIYRYLGINTNQIKDLKEYFEINKIKSIAFQYVRHKTSEDTLVLNILDALANKLPLNKHFLENKGIINQYFKKENELNLTYLKDELKNLDILINKIQEVNYETTFTLPLITNNPNEELKKKATLKLKELNLEKEEYLNRLNYELDIITKMNFSNYYLIVSDYVNYAKENKITVGPARGSGVSSLIAYLLNITSIDPLKYDLLFERFLNPERITYPDFDCDFADIDVNKVIEYLVNKYGEKHCARITTFSSFGAKGAINDIAKLFNLPKDEISLLSSSLNKKIKSLNDELNNNEKFKNLIEIHANYKVIAAIASKIENLKCNTSIHTSGVILTNNDITNDLVTYKSDINQLVAGFDYYDLEKMGLIKIDILSISNLSLIRYILDKVNKENKTNYDIYNYPYDDELGYKMIANGYTLGIFQLESNNKEKTELIKKFAPNSFDDLIALLALYRPGPIKNIHEFIARKNGLEYKLIDDSLKDILNPTYGILVYQEQVMQICQKVANFSLGKAYIMIKAISKKKIDVMKSLKESFISGAIKNNISKEKADKIYEDIESFSNYGFNKAHSVGYSVITSLMASLKARFPGIFYEALLNIDADSKNKKNEIINEAKENNVNILYPSINNSDIKFKNINNNLLFGLSSIKGISEFLANLIIQNRPYKDIYDFFIKMVENNVSVEIIKTLIFANALNEFNISKEKLIYNLDALINYANLFKNVLDENKDILRKSIDPPLLIDGCDSDIIIEGEYEALGIYLTSHPIYKIKQRYQNITNINNLTKDGNYNIIAKIEKIKLETYKGEDKYIEIIVSDETSKLKGRIYTNIENFTNEYKIKNIIRAAITIKNSYTYIKRLEKIGEKL